MKTFLFQAMVCAALMREVCYADSSSLLPAPASAENSAHIAPNPRDQDEPTGTPQTIPQNHQEGQSEAKPVYHPVNNPFANRSPGKTNPLQPGSTKIIGAAKPIVSANKIIGPNSLTVRSSSVIRPIEPTFKDARNRGPVTAVLGGSSQNKTTAVVNGTTINHKSL
jgi:hypothetical protein